MSKPVSPHMPGLRDPTERQQAIIHLAADLAARFSERADHSDPQSLFPFDNYRELHDSGYLRLAVPKQYGGDGAGVFDMVLAQEILARGDASTALVTGMHFALLGRVMDSTAWPDSVLADICATLAHDGGTINNCVTEAELGSISRGGLPGMAAERVDGGWRITGRKIFVTGAPVLRFLATAVVLPPSDDAPQGELVSAIVEGGSPGLSIEDTWSGALGLRGCGNYAVNYDAVLVPDARIVERVKIGGERKRPGTSGWNLPLAAVYLGIGQAACDTACHYANHRVPAALGAPIAGQPHVQQWIGEIDVKLRAARAVLHDTARAWVAGTASPAELAPSIAAAKFLCTNAACSVTETALRVAGGFSMTRALPLERYFRDARGGLFQPPQDDLALGMVGRAALESERGRQASVRR
ncbi:MAG TPA: acyl-CoA dehydrogenase family protein [Acetobacteraceae bacterium]|nr:acyl-CoA dehydrogenase family protein [Acetobacteraceae bacterium]